MDENEPGKQFQATDYDENGNIKLPPPPLAAAKKKRITVAELNKAIDDIRDVKFPETLNWIGELDNRFDKTDVEINETIPAQFHTLDTRIDNQDAAIGALADALRSHIKESAATPPEPAAEMEFAQPPQQMAGGQWRKSDIEAVASICEHMTDVLMICRALKAMSDLPDEDRTYLLTTACRAAGVPLSPGLQIRAGVRNVEA